jgi:hypothetical protein
MLSFPAALNFYVSISSLNVLFCNSSTSTLAFKSLISNWYLLQVYSNRNFISFNLRKSNYDFKAAGLLNSILKLLACYAYFNWIFTWTYSSFVSWIIRLRLAIFYSTRCKFDMKYFVREKEYYFRSKDWIFEPSYRFRRPRVVSLWIFSNYSIHLTKFICRSLIFFWRELIFLISICSGVANLSSSLKSY